VNDKSTGMRLARWFAVLTITGVGVASFVLSFAALRDLATEAHIPHGWAWLFPLIVDGTIVQATVSMVALAHSRERRYFLRVLAAGALVSIAGNSLHAAVAGRTLPWWVCAVVAAIAPVSLLVDTHGLAVLFHVGQQDSTPAVEPVTQAVKAAVTEPVSRKPAVRPRRDPATVARAVAMRADGKSYAEIARALNISPRTAADYAPNQPSKPVAPVRPLPAAQSAAVTQVRPRPVQPMLPIAVPVGGA
jgi:hypothetical protein